VSRPFNIPRRRGSMVPVACKCGCGEMVDRQKNEAKKYVDQDHYLEAMKVRIREKRRNKIKS